MIPSSCSRRYLVSNDIMSAISKYNNCEISQSKITTLLINERHITHMLVGKYFYIHDSYLLDFDMNDVILFNKKYFFLVVHFSWIHCLSNPCICPNSCVRILVKIPYWFLYLRYFFYFRPYAFKTFNLVLGFN